MTIAVDLGERERAKGRSNANTKAYQRARQKAFKRNFRITICLLKRFEHIITLFERIYPFSHYLRLLKCPITPFSHYDDF